MKHLLSQKIMLMVTAIFTLLIGNNALAQKTAFKDNPDGVAIEKGIKFAMLTFSLSTRKAENDNGLLSNYVDQSKSNWNTRLDGGYVFKKNLGAGLGLSYGQTHEDNIVKGSDGTLTYNKIYASDYSFRPLIKNFIPLDAKNRFYIINQTELQFSFGSSIRESTTNSILTRTYVTTQEYGIGLRPGVVVFVVKNFAFETNVDVFGLKRSVEKTKATGLPDARVVKTGIDLKINILALAFGFSYYF